MQTHRIITAGAGIAAVTLLATAPAAIAATPTYTVTSSPAQAAAGWLTTQFVNGSHLPAPDGNHFDFAPYGSSYYANYGENADVVFALAAAKTGRTRIATAVSYLAAHANDYADITGAQQFGPADGSIGKMALAARVAGANPTSFGGRNLLAKLRSDECVSSCGTGVVAGQGANLFDTSINESFVILAEARAGGAYTPSAAATSYFLSLQCANGGFSGGASACGSGAADLDSTSYGLMALTALGGHTTEVQKAVAWLQAQRKAGGYWESQGIANANSTGLATAALQGGHADVSTERAWLRSQQVRAGSAGAGAIKYNGTVTATTAAKGASPSVLATAQAVTGLVDNGGLATVTATGAGDGVAVFAPTARLSAGTVEAGRRQTATAAGFLAGEAVRAVIHSTPVTVGTAKANALGVATIAWTVPATIPAGAHTLTLTGLTSGLSVSRPLTVVAAVATGSPVAPSSTPAGTTTSSTGVLANSGRDGRTTVELGVLGALAVALGAGLLVLGRRRSH
jgi:hypothetical protein